MKPPELKRLAAKEKVPLGILEKDYVLTVVLAIIAELPLFNRMAFKGGTAIKKMYFPNARFSEDLDFTCFEDLSLPLLGVLQKTIGGKNISDVNFREITREEGPEQNLD